MAAITSEMVVAWLQRRNSGGQVSNESMGMGTANMNSAAPPNHLDQHLDSQTGQVHGVTWVSGTWAPSNLGAPAMGTGIVAASSIATDDNVDNTGYYGDQSDSSDSYDDDSDTSESEDEYDEESSDSSVYTSRSVLSSALSSFFETTDGISDTDDGANGGSSARTPGVYVVAGCRRCSMYFMVPEAASVCSQCGHAGLVHFSCDAHMPDRVTCRWCRTTP